jgi:hypothetical protein
MALDRPFRIAIVLLIVFGVGMSMGIPQQGGWRLYILCFVVGSVGGIFYLGAKRRWLQYWNGLPSIRRAIFVGLGSALVIAAILLSNRHKPDEGSADFIGIFGVLAVLALWGLYRIFSRLLDTIQARISGR